MTLSDRQTARRYLAIVQDPRGYPANGKPELAPPDGPEQPMLYTVVKTDDYEALEIQCDRFRDALNLIAGLSWPDNNPNATMGHLLGRVHDVARNALEQTENERTT